VQKELSHKNWIYVVCHISTTQELEEFINLWKLVRSVNLNQEENDVITWKWSPNGEYTAASTYKIQFYGSHTPFQVGNLWKAKAEPKIKIFSWTALHQRILTVDDLASRGMDHNPMCPLCNSVPEDERHLLTNCQFAREVICLLWSWFQLQGSPSYCSLQQGPADWLHANAAKANGANLKRATGVLLYCRWNM
jgi:hypothetical protein